MKTRSLLLYSYLSLFFSVLQAGLTFSEIGRGSVGDGQNVQAFALWISFHCKCVEGKENTLGCGGDMLMGDLYSELSCLREILMLHGFV